MILVANFDDAVADASAPRTSSAAPRPWSAVAAAAPDDGAGRGKDAEKLPEALAEAERLIVAALCVDARARTRLRLGTDRGRGLRRDRTLARPLGVVERARARAGLRAARRARRDGGGRARRRRAAADAARRARGAGAGDGAFVEALRARLDIPVETYDERFTTTLARKRPGARPRTRSPRRICSRAGWSATRDEAALAVLAVIAVVAVGAFARRHGSPAGPTRRAPPPPTTTGPPPLAQLKIIFPEGFTVRRWPTGSPRSGRSRSTSAASRRGLRAGVPRAVKARCSAGGFRKDAKRRSRASCSPRRTTSPGDEGARARLRPARRVPSALRRGRSPLRAVEEPHAVRHPDHRVDDREGGGGATGAAH